MCERTAQRSLCKRPFPSSYGYRGDAMRMALHARSSVSHSTNSLAIYGVLSTVPTA